MTTTAKTVRSDSMAIAPYHPQQSSEEFLRSEIERITDQVYQKAMQQEKVAQRLLSPDSIPRSSISIKLRCFLNEMTQLHQDGFLDGEFLVARGSDILLNLRSHDVSEIAEIKGGDPQFMIGSVSKQFTAVALLKALYEKVAVGGSEVEKSADVKKLLHLPISYFLKENEALWEGDIPDWVNRISLHHLLSHTSGLPDFTDCEGFDAIDASDRKWCQSPLSIKEIMNIISKYPLKFIPGAEFSYCNTGYSLIAEVIKVIIGVEFSRYVTEILFKPLKLSSTSSPETRNEVQLRESDPTCSRLVHQWNYDPAGDQELLPPTFLEDISFAKGAGSIISTASDLLKWNIALHQRKSVLPNSLYELFIKENMDGYAYGIGRGEFSGGIVLDHAGAIGSYTSTLSYFPDHELSIIQLSHVDIESPQIMRESDELMELLKDSIPVELERKLAIDKLLLERYPDRRGKVQNQEIIESFFKE